MWGKLWFNNQLILISVVFKCKVEGIGCSVEGRAGGKHYLKGICPVLPKKSTHGLACVAGKVKTVRVVL